MSAVTSKLLWRPERKQIMQKYAKPLQFQYTLRLSPRHYENMQCVLEFYNSFCAHYNEFKIIKYYTKNHLISEAGKVQETG